MEDVNSYNPVWRKMMGCDSDAQNYPIAKIFQKIFPELVSVVPAEI